MKTRNAVLAASVLSCSVAAGLSAEWSLSPREGVLVLRNGRTIEGHVTSVGDHYIVTFGNQAEVKLPAEQVEMYCTSLEHAYTRKRDALPEGNVTAHLSLASWCLNQGLFARAADQALMAYAMEPDHAGVAAIERRILFAARMASPSSAVDASEPEEASPASRHQALETLPPGTVEQFTQKVQPVLMNRCATNACHGIRSNTGLRLLRPAKGGALPNRYTQKNLRAALEFVDRAQPEVSPLITVPNRPHGGLDMPIFDDGEMEQKRQLALWVQRAAGSLSPRSTAPASFQSRVSADDSRGFGGEEMPVPMTTYGIHQSPDFADRSPTHHFDPNAEAEPAQGMLPANTSPGRDPLDAAIFNQYHRKRGRSGNPIAPPRTEP
ncbi:MAG: hypothetical protein ACC628_13945 [Pirellulaceae bacterium]